MFGASQKLWTLKGEEVGQDLAYAASHLNILSLCSSGNDIAQKLYTILQLLFNDTREVLASPVYHALRQVRPSIQSIALVSAANLEAVQGAADVCRTVLDLVRRTIGILEEALAFRD